MAKGDIIPDGEKLYKYINPSAIPEGQKEIPPGVFGDPNLSTDWEKYQKDPLSSFHISEGKTRIIEILVHDDIRNPENPKRSGEKVDAWKQEIIHDPVSAEDDPRHGENYSHSLIRGKKKSAVTAALVEHSEFIN